MFLERVTVRSYEKGLLFKEGEFVRVLNKGKYWFFDPSGATRVDIASMRTPLLVHEHLDLIADSGQLHNETITLELSDTQRALLWVNDRFEALLGPGQHVVWQSNKDVQIETFDISTPELNHARLQVILASDHAQNELLSYQIKEGETGILFIDGVVIKLLKPGCHAFWRSAGQVSVVQIELGETTLDISGQEILSRDKVSLRLNALVTYRVTDPIKAVCDAEDYKQSLYRESQMTLRAAVGTMDIDTLLGDRNSLVEEARAALVSRAAELGLSVIGFGIRDIILPGDMRELLNKVVESKKLAEANLITRREETAAMRSQANSARLLADNPALMRLKELELLEKIAAGSHLNILCGDKGIKDSILQLI